MKSKNVAINKNFTIYENSISLKRKKDFGIFYTDYFLANKMIKELSMDKRSTILDPCCGIGVFLEAAKKLGFRSIYGCDIDRDAIKICNKNNNNAIVCDSIFDDSIKTLDKLNIYDKVDCVIGNPPYAVLNDNNCGNYDYEIYDKIKKNGNNLFIGSIIQSIKMLKPRGILSYIIPKNFLHVDIYSKLRKSLLNKYDIIEIIDLGVYFKNVRGEQIILTIKKQKTNTNKITFKKLINNEFKILSSIPQLFYIDEIMVFSSLQDYDVYKKLNKNRKILQDYTDIKIHRGHSKSSTAIRGRDIRKYGFKDNKTVGFGNQLFIQNIYSAESGSIAAYGGNMDAGETITILSAKNKERCKLFLALLHSSIWNLFLYKFCYNSSKLTMHTDAKYLHRIPMPDEERLNKYMNSIIHSVNKLEKGVYMSRSWLNLYHELDDMIYLIYGMNKHDTLYISSEINKIQSKRWSA